MMSFAISAPAQQVDVVDSLALVAFYNALDETSYKPVNWLQTYLHNWEGVELRSDGRVHNLILSNKSLSGTLVPELVNLTELERLELDNNQLRGGIPVEFQASLIWYVNLSRNQLSGPLPPKMNEGVNSLCEKIDLSWNRLTGTIPSSFLSETRCNEVNLSVNLLAGTLPAVAISSIESLDLRRNELSGSVPDELLSGRCFKHINLSRNYLSGSIPFSQQSVCWYSHQGATLDLSSNQFSGNIPENYLDYHNNLDGLFLSKNQLTGPLPRLDGLGQFWIDGNAMSGTLDALFQTGTSLRSVNLSYNDFHGELSFTIPRIFYVLYLSGNRLSGTLDNLQFGANSELIHLELNDNNLHGEIPITALPIRLERLFLSKNNFDGSIEHVPFSDLPALKELSLSYNNFSGKFPTRLPAFLRDLYLSGNQFSDSLGALLSNTPNLFRLEMNEGQIEGAVPMKLPATLRVLEIKNNKLDVLPDLTNHPRFFLITLYGNRFTFDDLEPNARLLGPAGWYSPQDSIYTGLRRTPTHTVLFPGTGGSMNEYQWYRDGELLAGEIGPEIIIEGPGISLPSGNYHVEVTNTAVPGLTLYSRPISSDAVDTSTPEEAPQPFVFHFSDVYPNPASGSIRVPFTITETAPVTIDVFDGLGRHVRTLIDRSVHPGSHVLEMDVADLAPGMYVVRASAAEQQEIRRFIVAR